MVPGVTIKAQSHCGHIKGRLVIVPRLLCDHQHTMCSVCIDDWAEKMDFLVTERDGEIFDQAIDILERVR